MKVRAVFEFDVDVSEFDPRDIDIVGLAVDSTKREIDYMAEHGLMNSGEFEYNVVIDDPSVPEADKELIPDGATNDRQ